MAQRDYLMRLIEQALEAILQAAKFRQEKRYDQSVHSVILSMERLFGLTIRDLSSQSADQIFVQLTEGENPTDARNKCLIFAALNYQAGLTYAEQDLAALAQPAFYLALVFTLRALNGFSRTDLPSFTPEIDDLLSRLSGFELPPAILASIETYRTKTS